MATIKDVAKLAGVAVSTASYALNNSNKVSDHTRMKVLDAAKELNYQKNGIAADLKMAKTNTIALILGDLSDHIILNLSKAFKVAVLLIIMG